MEASQLKDKGGLKGEYTITVFKAGTKEVLRKIGPIKNLVVSSTGYGRNLIMRQLTGDVTYGIEITQGKIGSGTTAPTDNDTDLETAVLSNINVAEVSVANDVAIISFFIPSGDLANGTYNEFGMFIGSQLFARSIISPAFTKGSNEDTSIDYSLTLS